MVLASILLGLVAVVMTPREEEPQIIVPMVNIVVGLPGATPREVEERLTTPLEKLLWGISGVEYVYSASTHGTAMVTVRFKVNEPLEPSLVKVYDRIVAHFHERPAGSTLPIVRLRTIDDVPFLTLTLYGPDVHGYDLRRLALEVGREISEIPDVARLEVIGGERRQVRVLPDAARMAGRGICILDLPPAVEAASAQQAAGALVAANRETLVEAGRFLEDPRDLETVVVGVREGRPVYLGDVATVVDGPGEPDRYVFFGTGPAAAQRHIETFGTGGKASGGTGEEFPAVTLSLAKRPGANATALAREVLRRVDALEGTLIPQSVAVAVTTARPPPTSPRS
jgi:multidrug efflux pump subunit AcrB